MKYSSYRLAVLNFAIGLCRGSPGLPRTIRRMGYRDRFLAGGLLGRGSTVEDPVLVLASAQFRHSFFVEVCEDSEVDPRYLDRYAGVTAVDLRERTPLSQDQTELYGVVLFGLEEHRESLRNSIEGSKLKPTLLLRTPEGLVIGANPFPKVALANIFRPVLALDWETTPLGWVPFDQESHLAEVAQAVIPDILAHATGGADRVLVARMCEDHLLWEMSTTAARKRMRARINRVLSLAAAHEFGDFFTCRAGVVELTETARRALRAPGSPTLKRMARQQAAFLERLKG